MLGGLVDAFLDVDTGGGDFSHILGHALVPRQLLQVLESRDLVLLRGAAYPKSRVLQGLELHFGHHVLGFGGDLRRHRGWNGRLRTTSSGRGLLYRGLFEFEDLVALQLECFLQSMVCFAGGLRHLVLVQAQGLPRVVQLRLGLLACLSLNFCSSMGVGLVDDEVL